MKIFITQYFPVILSTIALIFSILSFWRTSKRYRVFFNDQNDYYLDSAVYCNDTSGHFIPESAVGYGINFSIDIVNKSKNIFGIAIGKRITASRADGDCVGGPGITKTATDIIDIGC